MISEAVITFVRFLTQSSDIDMDVSASGTGMREHGFEGPAIVQMHGSARLY